LLAEKFSDSDDQEWTFKTCGIMTATIETQKIFENIMDDMKGISCSNIMYSKY